MDLFYGNGRQEALGRGVAAGVNGIQAGAGLVQSDERQRLAEERLALQASDQEQQFALAERAQAGREQAQARVVGQEDAQGDLLASQALDLGADPELIDLARQGGPTALQGLIDETTRQRSLLNAKTRATQWFNGALAEGEDGAGGILNEQDLDQYGGSQGFMDALDAALTDEEVNLVLRPALERANEKRNQLEDQQIRQVETERLMGRAMTIPPGPLRDQAMMEISLFAGTNDHMSREDQADDIEQFITDARRESRSGAPRGGGFSQEDEIARMRIRMAERGDPAELIEQAVRNAQGDSAATLQASQEAEPEPPSSAEEAGRGVGASSPAVKLLGRNGFEQSLKRIKPRQITTQSDVDRLEKAVFDEVKRIVKASEINGDDAVALFTALSEESRLRGDTEAVDGDEEAEPEDPQEARADQLRRIFGAPSVRSGPAATNDRVAQLRGAFGSDG